MAVGDLERCVQYFLCAINFLFWIICLALLLRLRTSQRLEDSMMALTYGSSLPELWVQRSAVRPVLVAVTAFLALVAGAGMWGAARGSTIILILYGVSLFIMLCTEVASGAWNLENTNGLTAGDILSLRISMKSYVKESKFTYMLAWDMIQEEKHCCGVRNFMDWMETELMAPPDSCCKIFYRGCGRQALNYNPGQVFQKDRGPAQPARLLLQSSQIYHSPFICFFFPLASPFHLYNSP
uniref:Tetraspanin n=1 Tax=Eptatretus burgeri TaxID=7764 RepID=A0A8C4QG28_EPTBU